MDDLERRGEIVARVGSTPRQLVDHIIELENELVDLATAEQERLKQKPCPFPEHRGHHGDVTHLRMLNVQIDPDHGWYLGACEVCGSVHRRRNWPVG